MRHDCPSTIFPSGNVIFIGNGILAASSASYCNLNLFHKWILSCRHKKNNLHWSFVVPFTRTTWCHTEASKRNSLKHTLFLFFDEAVHLCVFEHISAYREWYYAPRLCSTTKQHSVLEVLDSSMMQCIINGSQNRDPASGKLSTYLLSPAYMAIFTSINIVFHNWISLFTRQDYMTVLFII